MRLKTLKISEFCKYYYDVLFYLIDSSNVFKPCENNEIFLFLVLEILATTKYPLWRTRLLENCEA